MPRFQTTSVNRKWTETRSAFRLTKLWSESTCNVNADRTEFFFTSLFDSSVKTNIFRAVFILLVISGVISVEKLVNKSNINPQRALSFLEERLFVKWRKSCEISSSSINHQQDLHFIYSWVQPCSFLFILYLYSLF